MVQHAIAIEQQGNEETKAKQQGNEETKGKQQGKTRLAEALEKLLGLQHAPLLPKAFRSSMKPLGIGSKLSEELLKLLVCVRLGWRGWIPCLEQVLVWCWLVLVWCWLVLVWC